MGEVDFEMSSQAKCWMYNEQSLDECREQACSYTQHNQSSEDCSITMVRKFACGYHNKTKTSESVRNRPCPTSTDPLLTMSQQDQETLVHFHAHQIQKLIGPNAILPLLKRGSSVLSTAIMLFRKFYLSNSVIDFHPRKIATASALLAVKTDCERNVPIDVLSHSTMMVEVRAQNDPLCGGELRGVTINEIEEAERALLEGCDYRLRCHHPYGAIKVLVSDVVSFFDESHDREIKNNIITEYSFDDSFRSVLSGGTDSIKKDHDSGFSSPRSVLYEEQLYQYDNDHRPNDVGLSTLCERALSVAQSALVYSDVNFLFPPGQIAFAAVALALDGVQSTTTQTGSTKKCNRLGRKMKKYLSARFCQKSADELSEHEYQVSRIITALERCPSIDLGMFSPFWRHHQCRYARRAEQQAIEIRRAIFTTSRLRVTRSAAFQPAMIYIPPSPSPPPIQQVFDYYYHQHQHQHQIFRHCEQHLKYGERNHRKRTRNEIVDTWTRPHHKIARVTPINTPFI